MARHSQGYIQDYFGKYRRGKIMREDYHFQNTATATLGAWLKQADQFLTELDDSNIVLDHQKPNDENASSALLLRQAQKIIQDSENRIKELERISTTDELTGIMNRRGFLRNFDREIDRVNRDKSQGGLLIMIDLDNFKMINDTYGHDAGDMALKVVASTLANDIRTMDVVARMGGDEFVILFANTNRKTALERVQFIIKKLNNLSFVWKGDEVDVRASLGLRDYKKGCKPNKIFSDADKNMYENKRQIKELGLRKQNKRMV